MSWIAIIAAMMPLIIKLIEWLISRQGKPLTGRQLDRVQRVLDRCDELEGEAVQLGCSPGNLTRGKRVRKN